MLLTVLISTVIVVAASAWHPADRHYGMTAAYERKLILELGINIQACVWYLLENTQEIMSERNGEYVPEFHAGKILSKYALIVIVKTKMLSHVHSTY